MRLIFLLIGLLLTSQVEAQSRRRFLIAPPTTTVDTDLAAYIATTGATDTAGLANLVSYIKGQGLWSNIRFWTFKSAQNKGSGTNVYALGGWTTNVVALVGAPTWATNGMFFTGFVTRGYITLTNIQNLSVLWSIDRQIAYYASSPDNGSFGYSSIRNSVGNYILLNPTSTGFLSGETATLTWSNGPDNRRAGTSGMTWSANEGFAVVNALKASGFGIWKNKTAQTLSLTTGTQDFTPSAAAVGTDVLDINASKFGPTDYDFSANTTRVVQLLCNTDLTSTQRDALTDLVNAL